MTKTVAIIGLGGVANAHLAAFTDVEEIDVIAGVEPRQERLDEMAARFGFRGYTDHQTMLEKEQPDIACVLTPAALHRPITEDCATAGVHVLCEKPIALGVTDAEAMLEVCETAGVQFFYGLTYRFLPAVTKAKELIAAGVVGDVKLLFESAIGGSGPEGFAHMGFSHYPKGSMGGSGMGIVDHGIHLVDLFPWLIGSRIVSVFGRGNISGEQPETEYACMNMANGAVGHLLYNDCTFSTDTPSEGMFSHGEAWNMDGSFAAANSWHPHPGSIHVHGTRGSLRIFHYTNQLILRDTDGIRQIPLTVRPPPAHFGMQMESFVRSIEAGTPPATTGQDALNSLRALRAIYKSAEKGRLINLDN